VLLVGGPHAAGQAVLGVVGDAHGVVLVLVGDDDQHRAEDLLLGDPHRVVDVGEDGRRDVVALLQAGRHLRATGDQARALLDAGLDVVAHPLLLVAADHRADEGVRVLRVADLQRLDDLLDGVDDLARSGCAGRGCGCARCMPRRC
jgi:hypothetical protein